jgi:hypothetical protein
MNAYRCLTFMLTQDSGYQALMWWTSFKEILIIHGAACNCNSLSSPHPTRIAMWIWLSLPHVARGFAWSAVYLIQVYLGLYLLGSILALGFCAPCSVARGFAWSVVYLIQVYLVCICSVVFLFWGFVRHALLLVGLREVLCIWFRFISFVFAP